VQEAPDTIQEHVGVSMVRRYPLRCFAYFVVTVALIAGVVWSLMGDYTWLPMICGGVLAFVAFRFGTWWLRMHNTALTITERRVIVETGLFSRNTAEVARKEVYDVLVSQGPVMRILGVGDLVIRSTAGGPREIVIMGLPEPGIVARKIAPLPAAPEEPAVAQAPNPA
jgi:uncharacterized membrane protein YdbT with pleckstrin-like domain